MSLPMIRVLVVDDDDVQRALHSRYVEKLDGFQLVGEAASGRAALHRLAQGGVDLLLLDIQMPDMTGLEVLKRASVGGSKVDAIVVSSLRDMNHVSEAMRSGVAHYLLKPFTYSAFKVKLEEYASFLHTSQRQQAVVSQREVDQLFAARHPRHDAPLPKTLAAETLRQVADCLLRAREAMTAEEVGKLTGLARVSSRRYLEHLVEVGQVERRPTRTGQAGRPQLRYVWNGASSD